MKRGKDRIWASVPRLEGPGFARLQIIRPVVHPGGDLDRVLSVTSEPVVDVERYLLPVSVAVDVQRRVARLPVGVHELGRVVHLGHGLLEFPSFVSAPSLPTAEYISDESSHR
jgi:hypothetical protein